MIMMCERRFILVSDADNEGDYACLGVGGKSLYLLLNFVVIFLFSFLVPS